MPNTKPAKKQNAVLGSIKENLRHVTIIAEPTIDEFKKDKEQTGDSREYTVKEFVQAYFPEYFFVRKGLIFSKDGTSRSIDSVLLFPNHPRLTTPKRAIIIAEGVFAAIEVKPDISTLTENSDFHTGLQQIKSVKALNRDIDPSVTARMPLAIMSNNLHKKIPCVLFSFKSAAPSETISYMSDCILKGILNYEELPDIILTLDNGIIFYTPYFSNSPLWALKKQWLQMNNPDPGDNVFIHLTFKDQADTLAFFIFLMYNFTPPSIPNHSFILTPYLLDAMNEMALEGTTKFTVYSQK